MVYDIVHRAQVLRKCSMALRPDGYVYIGDCRSLEHMRHFHTDVSGISFLSMFPSFSFPEPVTVQIL
jgi:hypothetical protein